MSDSETIEIDHENVDEEMFGMEIFRTSPKTSAQTLESDAQILPTENTDDEINSLNSPPVIRPVTNISIRDKCVYGSTCYRKNANHKKEFSHPGDADYDILDNRPECQYGIHCYRKNPQHRKDFKHSRQRITRVNTLASGDVQLSDYESTDEESVDESEYEPSDSEFSDTEELHDFDFDDNYDESE